MTTHTYKWLGERWAYNVPARDLTEDEFANLTPEQQAQVASSHKHITPRAKPAAPAPAPAPIATPEIEPAKEV